MCRQAGERDSPRRWGRAWECVLVPPVCAEMGQYPAMPAQWGGITVYGVTVQTNVEWNVMGMEIIG